MCGIFGWVAHGATEADQRLLHLAAVGAADRGPHAHGWAVPGEATHRALGPLQPALVPRSVPRLLGHARLATYGAHSDLAAVQPIEVDGHRVAHNGNAPELFAEHPQQPSDTAALAIVYAAHRIAGNDPCTALKLVTARLQQWALAVLDSDGSLVVSRRGLPLRVLHTPSRGVYLSSGQLPGSTPLPEGKPLQLAGTANTKKVTGG